jgi:hypothetical protein
MATPSTLTTAGSGTASSARVGPSPLSAMAAFQSRSPFSPPEKRILVTQTELARGATRVPNEEWIKTLEDGRKVRFTYQELPDDGAFITAQIEGNKVVYSIVLTKARNPLSCEHVESHFKGELSKK